MKTFGSWAIAGLVLLLAAGLVYTGRSPDRHRSNAVPRVLAPAQSIASPAAILTPTGAPPVTVAVASAPAKVGFEGWLAQFNQAPASSRPALLAQGELLARERRARMADLIRQDPQRALQEALPYSIRRQIPENLLAMVEQPVSGRGEFRQVCHTPFPGQEADAHAHTYEVIFGGKRFDAFTYGQRLAQPSQQGSYLHGISVQDDNGREIVALSDDILRRVTDRSEIADLARAGRIKRSCDVCNAPAPAAGAETVFEFGGSYVTTCTSAHAQQLEILLKAAHGTIWASGSVAGNPPDVVIPPNGSRTQGLKKLLYIRVLFADDPIPPQSDDGARSTVQSNNRYFFEGSYGKVWWDSTITPLIRLPQRKNYYGENPGALLGDAAAGAAALGYFTRDYFSPHYVLHNSLVQYDFGGLSSGILNASPGALIHELGHNFGLPHANFWQPEGRDPGPRQPQNQPPYPIDPDSALGHNALDAPWLTVKKPEPMDEYGNFNDVMGSGGGHFSTMFKNMMHWLPNQFVKDVTVSTTNRLYAFDTPNIFEGRFYAMRVRKDIQREYWLSYRQANVNNRWFSSGLEVTWNFGRTIGVQRGFGDNELIDTTPGSSYHKQDSALVVGRTLNDRHANVFITPVAMGGGPAASNKWMDVVVQKGPFPANQVPTFALNADVTAVSVDSNVTFTATAQDLDGDQLAYHWDFGDHTFGTNGPVQAKSFSTPGNYVVRCEVSDMKGGVVSAHVVITVGAPNTFTISGRVLDTSGNPVQGVRVHNSGNKPSSPGANETDLGTYRYGFTDSQGYYVIGNVPAGSYSVRAFMFGYRTEPFNFLDPARIEDGNANGLDFVATPLTRVGVTRNTDADEAGTPGSFTITRYKPDGDYSEDLRVRFTMSGTAFNGTHYTLSMLDGESTDQVIIPAGSASVDLFVTPLGDPDGDGGKDAVLTLLLQTNFVRYVTVLTNVLTTNNGVITTNTMFVQQTNRYTVPGWELRPVGAANTLTWFQTDPTYIVEGAEAAVRILDDDPPGVPVVSIFVLDGDAAESRADSASLMFLRSGAPITSDLQVFYSLSGIASNGLDFVRLPGTITIPAGQEYALLSLTAVDDLFVEGHEYLSLSLLPAPAGEYESGAGSASMTIVDDDLPEVSIFASTSLASRGGNSGRLTVSRSGSTREDLTVNYLVTGSAVSGIDFNVLSGTVVIPAGQLSANIDINPVDTSTNLLPRTVTVLLSDATTYDIFNQTATVTIVDSALPSVTLASSGDTVAEGAAGTFTVTRTGPTTNSLRVYFEVGGSAWEGTDYSFLGTFVDIPAGAASAVINFNTINDNAREVGDSTGNETIIVQLRSGTNYHLANPSGRTVRITDDDGGNLPAVGFMLASSTVREDAGFAVMYLKVSANPATNRPIQIEYRVTGGSAIQDVNYINSFGDTGRTGILDIVHYTRPDPPPMFFNFENGIYPIGLQVLNSPATVGNRTVTISLFNPSRYLTNVTWFTNAGVTYSNVVISPIPTNAFLGPSLTHTLTILDVGQSVVSVASSADYLYEAGGQAQRFIVTRDGPTNAPLTVSYVLSGTAAAGSDYTSPGASQTVVIPAGTNSVSIPITPLNDPTEEMAETVIIDLLPGPGYALGGRTAGMTLVSDDGTVQFLLAGYEAVEGAGIANVAVIRSGSTNITATVQYVIQDGTATNGVDYLGTNGVLTFAPGETLQEIQIPILDDSLVEPNETIGLSLTNPSGGVALGGQRFATLAIVNDDTEIGFAQPAFSSPENGAYAVINIQRLGVLEYTNRVTFAALTNTATSADFVPTNLLVEFLPGQTNATVSVALIDDELFDLDEQVALQLADPTGGAALAASSNATLVIVDDECRVDFAVTSYFAREYSNTVTLILRRSGGTVNPVSVTYATGDGTASNGFDYATSTGTVVFAGDRYELDTNGTGQLVFVPGDSVQTMTVTLIDDIEGEGNESFLVSLSNPEVLNDSLPASVVLGAETQSTVTILDNDTPGNVDYEYGGVGPNAPVHAVSLDYQNRAVIGGEFTQVDGITFIRVARLHPYGAYDASFNPGAGANGNVYAVAAAPDAKVYIGGAFTSVNNTNRQRIARLNADGKLDLAFNPGAGVNGAVRAIAIQANGQVLIAGDFTTVAGAPRAYVARLNADGSLDGSFDVVVNAPVTALAVQPGGEVLLGGGFSSVNGAARSSLARVTSVGVLDASFAIGSGFNGPVRAVAVQEDGRILAGGAFSLYDGLGMNNLARLHPDGSRDFGFVIEGGPNGAVNSVGISPNSKIVIAGDFTAFNGYPANRITRLKSSGALDLFFVAGNGANAAVRALAVQSDTAIVIGGDFTEVHGIARNYVARIHGDERSNISTVEFGAVNFNVSENAGPAVVSITRTGNTNTAFTLTFRTYDLTATNGLDYVGITNEVSFVAGQVTAQVLVNINDDPTIEGDERFGIALSGAPSAVDLSGASSATVTIQDDEKAIQFESLAYVATEGPSNALVTIARIGGLEGTISATFQTSDGTAQANGDYLGVTAQVIFAPGQTSSVVEVPMIDDPAGEPAETVILRLTNPVGCELGTPTEATLTIVDNDFTFGVITRSNTAPIVLLDAQPAAPYPSTIDVNNLTGVLSHVAVQLVGVNHRFASDIDVLLVGPGGFRVVLMSDAGGGLSVSNAVLTFDDLAAAYLPSNSSVVTGTYRPTDYGPADTFFSPAPAGPYGGSLADFAGLSPNGAWSLYVLDDRGSDAGVISNGWRLILTTVLYDTVAEVGVTGIGPAAIEAGNTATYSFVIHNAGPNGASSLVFSNTLPPEMLLIYPPEGCSVVNGTIFCSRDFLAAGDTYGIDFKVLPTVGGTYTNRGGVSAREADTVYTNNIADVVTVVAAGTTADLRVTLSDNPDPAYVGQTVTYRFTVTNQGPLAATGVLVTNELPITGTLVSATVSQGSVSNLGDRVIFNVGTLPLGAGASGAVVVQPRFAGVMSNTIAAGANEPDLSPANTATEFTSISAAADLSVAISESRDPVGINANMTYNVQVVNNGPSDAVNASLFYTLPAQLALVSFTGSQGSSYASGGSLIFEFGDLPIGASALATIVIRTTVSGTFTNTATAVSSVTEVSPANNTAVEATTVSAAAGGGGGQFGSGIIDNGTIQLGVHPEGHLNVEGGEPSISGTRVVGLRYLPTRAESTAPGCLCEGWGVADALSGLSGGANESSDGGPFGLAVESFSSDGITARSVVRVSGRIGFGATNAPRPTFRVTHYYHPSSTTNLYQVDVTVENISTNITEVLYRRVMDWDIEPTPFNEYSTVVKGDSTNLVYTSDNGFASADPLRFGGFILATNNFVDSGPTDHGALFDFNFGLLGPGQAKTFTTYYGAAGTEKEAFTAVARVGAEAYSFGKPTTPGGKTNGTPNTFIFAFGGIGGTALAGADVRVSNVTPSPFVALGSVLNYTIRVTNAGPEMASNVVMTATLPPTATLAGLTTTRGTIVENSGVVTGNIGLLPAATFATITIAMRPVEEGPLTNIAVVTTTSIDFNLPNNVSTNITTAVSAGTFANPSPITIADAAPANPYPSIIVISNAPALLSKVTVTLTELEHAYPADIDILLVGPQGHSAVLMSDAGAGHDITGVTLRFDDDAPDLLPMSSTIVSGDYRPTDYGAGDIFFSPAPLPPWGAALSVFAGSNPNGTWSLYIVDDQGSDQGHLVGGWRLSFVGGSTVALSAQLVGGSIVLSWPESATGYELQSAPDANGPWSAAGGSPTPVNGRFIITVPATGERQFFRLYKP